MPNAVPSMRQLHLHVMSLDLQSESLKNKKHFNSFATRFMLPPEAVAAQLESGGRVQTRGHAAEEASLKADMHCPVSGVLLKNIPAVKQHLASPAYAAALRTAAAGSDIVSRWPAVGGGP